MKLTKNTNPEQLQPIAGIFHHKWTLPIVRSLERDAVRFKELHRSIDGVTQKVLTETLRKLERCGVVHRTLHPTIPPKVEYRLTPLGLDLLKLSDTLIEWTEMHTDEILRAQRAYDRRNKVQL